MANALKELFGIHDHERQRLNLASSGVAREDAMKIQFRLL